ncbi:hypothetical protein [Paludisphaera borealis]|uniref:hypothetical protein n=1 Tax=Paludisphaera borealis TaxID=1387353 RepID=UPI0009705D56|nr:hypothetical protein [Paludisphaera borealis]
MLKLERSKSRVIPLLLIPALAFGPIGCGGPEFIPLFVAGCSVVGIAAITVYEIQQVQSAQLDIEMKTLRLQGLKNGQVVESDHRLDADQVRKIVDSGKVKINGKVLVMRPE